VYAKPPFIDFVLLRFMFVLFVLSASVAGVVYYHRTSPYLFEWVIGSIVLAGIVLVWMVYRWAKRIAVQLERINRYLRRLEADEDTNEARVHFFTREFDDIYHNVLRVVKKVNKREKEKRRYHAKLKLKNRQRADMISAIAHEFRNPVAAITGYAQTLREDPDIPADLRERFLQKIYTNGEKIEALLGRLVLWNSFESGETTLHYSRFSLVDLARDTAASLQEKYRNRHIEIVYGKNIEIVADRTLMEAVLKNLTENALKYSKDEVVIHIDEQRLCVIDSGMGIGKEEIEKVTKKFYRNRTHSWDNSMGLGLAIVKTVLKMHGTTLRIKSELEKGSEFCFDIAVLQQSDEKNR
jgi:signal transduction histidine kinase